MVIMSDNDRMLWDEAREWAVCEILAKYRKELAEAHSNHFRRLTKRAGDMAYCDCQIYLPNPNEFIPKCIACGKPPRP